MMNINHIASMANYAIICRILLLLRIWYSPMYNIYFLGSASSTCNEIRNVVREWTINLGITIFFCSHINVKPRLLSSRSMIEAMIAPHENSGTWDFCVEMLQEIVKATPVNFFVFCFVYVNGSKRFSKGS